MSKDDITGHGRNVGSGGERDTRGLISGIRCLI